MVFMYFNKKVYCACNAHFYNIGLMISFYGSINKLFIKICKDLMAPAECFFFSFGFCAFFVVIV